MYVGSLPVGPIFAGSDFLFELLLVAVIAFELGFDDFFLRLRNFTHSNDQRGWNKFCFNDFSIDQATSTTVRDCFHFNLVLIPTIINKSTSDKLIR